MKKPSLITIALIVVLGMFGVALKKFYDYLKK